MSNVSTTTAAAKAHAPKRPVAAPKAPAVNNAVPAMENDNFMTKAPSAAQLAQARAAVKALDTMPAIPLNNTAKKAWLEQARKLEGPAVKGESLLRDAAFFTHSIPDAEADAATAKLDKFKQTVQRCEERGGIKPYPGPLNPFRPLNQATKSVEGMMGNPVGAVVGVVAIVPAMVVDTMDFLTRGLQVIAWPFEAAWWGIHQAGSKLFNIG